MSGINIKQRLTCSIDKALPKLTGDQWLFQTPKEIFEAAADYMYITNESLTQAFNKKTNEFPILTPQRTCYRIHINSS